VIGHFRDKLTKTRCCKSWLGPPYYARLVSRMPVSMVIAFWYRCFEMDIRPKLRCEGEKIAIVKAQSSLLYLIVR
jgi:hypothetical protein